MRPAKNNDVKGHLCMLFRCFLDDSKDQEQSKIFASSGFLGGEDDWIALRVLWNQGLKECGINYFKTSEWKMLRGEFARFKTPAYPTPKGREAANKIRNSLLEIPRLLHNIKGIGCLIPIEDYRRVCDRPEAQQFFAAEPYRRALEGVFNEVLKAVETYPGKHQVAFVHDDGDDFDELHRYYKEYKATNARHANMLAGFIPLDDKQHPPLQMADAIANFSMESGVRWLDNRKPIPGWPFNVYHIGIWDEEYMLGLLRHELRRRGKPIPVDLESEGFNLEN